ncbi:MAG: response regulator [Pseudomonadota bacterium]
MRLLIVDDSRIIRNRIQRAVRDYNLEVVGTAGNGKEAIQLVSTVDPQLVTMDLTMPEVDGIESIERILAINPGLLILVVSALADKATAIEAIKKGAHGFLCKPFTEEELTDALGLLIKGSAL